MHRIDYEYADAKGRKHKMSITTDSKEELITICETLSQVSNCMRQNGTIINFVLFVDMLKRGES